MYKISNILVLVGAFAFNLSGINADEFYYLPGRKLDYDKTVKRVGFVNTDGTYQGTIFSESDYMALCDSNRDNCLSFNHFDNGEVWFSKYYVDSVWDSYLSRTRCDSGVDAENVTSPNGNTYKKCKGYDQYNIQKNTYPLPPDLCQTTCEKDQECVGYAVDTQGQNCITYKGCANPYSAEYVYMSESNIMTSPLPSFQKMKAFALLNSTMDSNCDSCMSFGSCSGSTIKTSCGVYTCCDDSQTLCLSGKCPSI